MAATSRFRIFYARGDAVLTERVEATCPSEAIGVARAHGSDLLRAQYFEVWQGAHLVFSSTEQVPDRTQATG